MVVLANHVTAIHLHSMGLPSHAEQHFKPINSVQNGWRPLLHVCKYIPLGPSQFLLCYPSGACDGVADDMVIAEYG